MITYYINQTKHRTHLGSSYDTSITPLMVPHHNIGITTTVILVYVITIKTE